VASIRIAPAGGTAIPLRGAQKAGLHTLAMGIAKSDAELRRGHAGAGGFQEPKKALSQVPRDASSVAEAHTQSISGFDISGFRGALEVPCGFDGVARDAFSCGITCSQGVQSRGMSLPCGLLEPVSGLPNVSGGADTIEQISTRSMLRRGIAVEGGREPKAEGEGVVLLTPAPFWKRMAQRTTS